MPDRKMTLRHEECDSGKVREVLAGIPRNGIDACNALDTIQEQAHRLNIDLNSAEESEATGQLLDDASINTEPQRALVRKMTKAQIRLYNKQFEAEMAAMSVFECRRWNSHLSEGEAEDRISRAKAAVSKNGTGHTGQEALF